MSSSLEKEFSPGDLRRSSRFPLGRVKFTMHKLKFKSAELIRLVEQRPVLWDRTSVQYVNKMTKEEAWNEIYNHLYPNFASFSRDEQQILGAAIGAKWRNLRDAFIRSVKRKQSAEKNLEVAKTYIYSDHLKFLLSRKKVKRDNTVTQSNIDYVENASQESAPNDLPMVMIGPFDGLHASNLAQPAIESNVSNDEVDSCQIEEQQLSHQEEEQSHNLLEPQQDLYQLPDEDTAFFASITSSIRNMNEDEKLEFRIGALELIKKIKQARKIEQLKRLQATRGHSHQIYQHNLQQSQTGSPVKEEIE